jgi:hypothetical protein
MVVFLSCRRGSKNSASISPVEYGRTVGPTQPPTDALDCGRSGRIVARRFFRQHVREIQRRRPPRDVVFPLLAVTAGCGCEFFWQSPGKRRFWGRSMVTTLLLWQCLSSLKAHTDYIAYFNERAGQDPSRGLVTGCDLDCGQDLFRLSQALRERRSLTRILASGPAPTCRA